MSSASDRKVWLLAGVTVGILILVAIPVTINYLNSNQANPASGSAPPNPAPSSPAPPSGSPSVSSHPRSTPSPQQSNPWLDQLPISGPFTHSSAAPDAGLLGKSLGNPSSLPHAILINPGTKVSIKLGGGYKKLNLIAACLKGVQAGASATLKVRLDGKPFLLNPPSSIEEFDPLSTGILEWSIRVAGVRYLHLVVGSAFSLVPGCPLLVTGSLTR